MSQLSILSGSSRARGKAVIKPINSASPRRYKTASIKVSREVLAAHMALQRRPGSSLFFAIKFAIDAKIAIDAPLQARAATPSRSCGADSRAAGVAPGAGLGLKRGP